MREEGRKLFLFLVTVAFSLIGFAVLKTMPSRRSYPRPERL
jgi:hypothetical protein